MNWVVEGADFAPIAENAPSDGIGPCDAEVWRDVALDALRRASDDGKPVRCDCVDVAVEIYPGGPFDDIPSTDGRTAVVVDKGTNLALVVYRQRHPDAKMGGLFA